MLKSKIPIQQIQNRRGQSLIESLALSAGLLVALSCLGALLYFGFVHVGMNYLLHEFLVCKLTSGEKNCQREFYKKATPFLFSAKVLRFESSSLFGKEKVRLVLQMPLRQTLTLKKDLEIYP